DLRNDDAPFLITDRYAEHGGTAGTKGGIAAFGGQFHVLGMQLTAADDDQVGETPDHKHFLAVQEAEVAGSQKWTTPGTAQAGAKGPRRLVWPIPVLARDARSRHPDLAHPTWRAGFAGFRLDDFDFVARLTAATAHDRHTVATRRRNTPGLPRPP